jgi:hypothetical protein
MDFIASYPLSLFLGKDQNMDQRGPWGKMVADLQKMSRGADKTPTIYKLRFNRELTRIFIQAFLQQEIINLERR